MKKLAFVLGLAGSAALFGYYGGGLAQLSYGIFSIASIFLLLGFGLMAVSIFFAIRRR